MSPFPLFAVAVVLAGAPEVAAQPAPVGPSADAYYQFLIGRRRESEGDVDKALAALREAARLAPTAAEVRAEIASILAREGRGEEAVEEARAALAIDARNREANRVLGALLASTVDEGTGRDDQALVSEAITRLEQGRRSDGIDFDATLEMTLARLYLREKENDRAIAVLTGVVAREPAPEAWLLLAQAQMAAGHPELAADALEQGADVNPRLLVSLGELYERQLRYDRAASAYERAAAFNPQSPELKMRWATALLNAPEDASATRARDLLLEVSAARPTDDRPLYLLSQAERRLRDYDAAEATARRLIAIDPKGLWGPYALASVFEDRREYRRVVDTLAPAVAAWKPSAAAPSRQGLQALTHLGFAQMQLGQHEAAIATFERARGLAPGETLYDTYLAQANLNARRYDAAHAILQPARAARPDDVRLAQLDARALAGAGRRDEAIAVLKRLVDANPAEVSAYLSLADMLQDGNRTDDALRVLDDAGKRFEDNLDVLFQRGALLDRAKQPARAESAFREVLRRDPLHAPALNYLGYMFAERGERLDEAIELVQRALKIDPGNGSYLDSLGWAYYRQRRYDLALPPLTQAGEQLPANSVVQDHLGDTLDALGRRAEAVKAWERALAGDRDAIDVEAIKRKIARAGAQGR
jgi:tetratricopeptide (TPR) repeat protein